MADTREVTQAFFSKMASADFTSAFAMMADDVRYTVAGNTPASGLYNGLNDLNARLGPLLLALKNIRITLVDVIVEGDRAVAITRAEADAPFGRYTQNPAMFVLRVENGRIVELLEMVDTVMLETRVFGKKLV
jgi:ketosteroid isomerase-like protein